MPKRRSVSTPGPSLSCSRLWPRTAKIRSDEEGRWAQVSQHCWVHRPTRGIAHAQPRAQVAGATSDDARPEVMECFRCGGATLVHWVASPMPTPARAARPRAGRVAFASAPWGARATREREPADISCPVAFDNLEQIGRAHV